MTKTKREENCWVDENGQIKPEIMDTKFRGIDREIFNEILSGWKKCVENYIKKNNLNEEETVIIIKALIELIKSYEKWYKDKKGYAFNKEEAKKTLLSIMK